MDYGLVGFSFSNQGGCGTCEHLFPFVWFSQSEMFLFVLGLFSVTEKISASCKKFPEGDRKAGKFLYFYIPHKVNILPDTHIVPVKYLWLCYIKKPVIMPSTVH